MTECHCYPFPDVRSNSRKSQKLCEGEDKHNCGLQRSEQLKQMTAMHHQDAELHSLPSTYCHL